MAKKPALERVCSCHAPLQDGVPSPRHIVIYYDNTNPGPQAYVISTIKDSVAESTAYRGSRQAAEDLAKALGYTEIVV